MTNARRNSINVDERYRQHKTENGFRLSGDLKKSFTVSPLVSIITAVYNGEKYLEESIKSVINQEYGNVEYIIIDGGSTDGTLEIIKKYEQCIDYWVSEPDKGIGDAWNKGLALARGEIIGLLNADDFYDPSSVSIAVNGINVSKPLITYGITRFLDELNYVVALNNKVFRPTKLFVGFGFMHTSCFVTRKAYEEVGGFDPTVPIAVDTDWLVRAHRKGIEFKQLNNTINMRVGGISDRQKMPAFRQYMAILLKHGFPKSKVYAGYLEHWVKVTITNKLNTQIAQNMKTQLAFILLKLFNVSYKLIPFFSLKKSFASIFGVKIGKHSYIHTPVRFFHFGRLTISDNSVVNSGCYLDNRRGINIGRNVSIAHDVKIYTLGHEIDDPYFRLKGASVKINDNAVIFANAQIMPGVEIGEGAIVYPGSVVTRDVEPYCVVGGNPAKKLRERERNIKYELDYGFWFAN